MPIMPASEDGFGGSYVAPSEPINVLLMGLHLHVVLTTLKCESLIQSVANHSHADSPLNCHAMFNRHYCPMVGTCNINWLQQSCTMLSAALIMSAIMLILRSVHGLQQIVYW